MTDLRKNLQEHPVVSIIAIVGILIGIFASLATIDDYWDKRKKREGVQIPSADSVSAITNGLSPVIQSRDISRVATVKKEDNIQKKQPEPIEVKRTISEPIVKEIYPRVNKQSNWEVEKNSSLDVKEGESYGLIGGASLSAVFYPNYCYINLFFPQKGKKFKERRLELGEEITFEDSKSEYKYDIKFKKGEYFKGELEIITWYKNED